MDGFTAEDAPRLMRVFTDFYNWWYAKRGQAFGASLCCDSLWNPYSHQKIMARHSVRSPEQPQSADDDARHEELFGHLAEEPFTAEEAAEYLEVSLVAFQRFVDDGTVIPSRDGALRRRFCAAGLKRFKRQRKAEEREAI